jgi:epoxyqueuosine reductase
MAGRQADKTGVEPVAAVPLTLTDIEARLAEHHLTVLGGFACENDEGLPAGTRTLIMIGPGGAGYWPHVTAQPEWDSAPDPVDRWSRRVIGHLACDLGAKAVFPFGGPPWHPFHRWAVRTGRVWESPVRLLVHQEQGLMVSFRGALALKEALDLPAPPQSPCTDCAKPCLTACPVGALTAAGYNLPACHSFLATPAGHDCMDLGCAVRRACPVSQTYARMPEQSAYHMRQFHR